ncbi:MAG TPA: hypothetical protein VGT01_03475 [Candidatus Dormibacteraeota bacterium]|nr:hypothetical protein [Candidatus Dormibacteraeota bacterium]
MYLLAIGAIILVLGLLGVRTSPRIYLLIAAVAVVFSYIAYTR